MNRRVSSLRVFALVIAFCLLGLPTRTALAATLTHRYSFDTGASDSVGSANGVLQGHAYVTNGALVLDGTNSSVRLPNDLFTNYDSISFEVWYADAPVGSPSNQLYNFSGSNGGMNYLLFGQGNCSVGGSQNTVSLPAPAVGGTNHLVWTQDSVLQTARLYVNGTLTAASSGFTNTPAVIGSTTNDLIGAGATNMAVSNFKGRILEFRTYQGALSPLDVAVSDALGPGQSQLNPGALQDVRIIVPPPTGPGALFRIGVLGDFANVTNVNISTLPGLGLSSDNTNVIIVSPDQRLQTVGFGVADITASYQGLSNTLAVTVGVPQDVALIHRYSFNEQTNDWIVHDSMSGADGRIFSIPLYSVFGNGYFPSTAFTGNGELQCVTGGNFQGLGGYVSLPPDILSSLSEVSVEAWVTWTRQTLWPWQRIFDFGGGTGNYFFLTTEANTFVTNGDVVRFTTSTNGIGGETPRLDWTNILPLNVTSFVAVAYSPVRGIAKMYINGQPVASGMASIPLSAIIDTNDWLGKSQYSADSYFNGRYDEFRIYRGLLSDADVVADYDAGPNVVGVDYELHDYLSSNSLAITWGPSATNWFLESSPTLGSDAVWTQVSGTPTLQNGRYRVTVPISGKAEYFRLHAPL